MHEMLSLPHFFGFLFAVPAPGQAQQKPQPDRHRAVQSLRLSTHILRDIGMEDYEDAINDQRWVQRPDLTR